MEYTAKQLRDMLRAAEEAERNAGKEEFVALPKAYEWRLTQMPFGFRVECRLDEASRDAYHAWKAAFPASSQSAPTLEWHGMTYHLLYAFDGTPVLIGGGGSILLNLERNWSGDPKPITKAQAEQFRAGIIPKELKKAW